MKSTLWNCFPNCGFQRVDDGLKAPHFDFSVFFFTNALVSVCRIFLQSSESLQVGSFSYSATTVWPPSVESAVLINLFLFFGFEMNVFNDVETDDVLKIFHYIHVKLVLQPVTFLIKGFNLNFLFFSAGSLSLLFLIWLETKFKWSICPVTSSSSPCVLTSLISSSSHWRGLFNLWFAFSLFCCLDKLSAEI